MILDENQLKLRAEELALEAKIGDVFFLEGDLGAGKTTFARAFVQALIPEQSVKSPTYTLVESYQAPEFMVHHMDLYRLADGEELEMLGFRDLIEGSVLLIEWPEKADGFLPTFTKIIKLDYHPEGRVMEEISCAESNSSRSS